jgi:superfamily II helicase
VIADKARLRSIRRLEKVAGVRLPERAFHGVVLDTLSSRLDFERLDPTTREQLLEFVADFLRCSCKKSPLCGCPERLFAELVLELRESGLDHRQISAHLADVYGLDLFPADILSYLEDSVHVLEAITKVATLQDRPAVAARAREHILALER